ncbi:MAG: XTP/dITP diphosphatase [Patescibacteria group bacterium]
MAHSIKFITGNQGKVKSLQNYLFDLPIEVEGVAIDLIEPQSMSIEYISQSKAKQAFEKLKSPLIVHDSGFFINSLNGFPGPYIKDISKLIGNQGIMKLMQGITERSAYFLQSVSIVDKNGLVNTFTSKHDEGSICINFDNENDNENELAWGSIWNIYIPPWSNKTLSQISPEEIKQHEQLNDNKSEFRLLANWLKENIDLI